MLRGTVFGVQPNKGDYSGFFILYQILMYIVPSSIFLNLFEISDFWVAFKVEQDSVFVISLLILFCMISYYFFIAIFTRLFPLYCKLNDLPYTSKLKNAVTFNRLSLLACLFLICIAYFIFGIGHSFSTALAGDVSVSGLRHELTERKEARVIKHLFIFIIPLLTAVLASPAYKKLKVEKTISLIVLVFIASWAGSKGPLLIVFIVFLISHATFNQIRLTFKSILKLVVFIGLILYLVYWVVLVQYAHLDNISLFMDYFYQRVFVAQMIGVYEQFNLWLHDYNYIWHGIPFASNFVDYPQYHKDLMLISEGRSDPGSIGIKNTLFIAEAYGMGGWYLLLLSPMITAFNFCLSFVWLTYLLNKVAFHNFEFTKRVVAISLFSYIGVTGGFSDLMLFKVTIMVTILISPFISLVSLISKLKK